MIEQLHLGLEKLLLSNDELESKMEQYIAEIIRFNGIHNIVNTNDESELAVRHILDSLVAAKELKKLSEQFESAHFADIGSGGGLPGIPLAAALPDIHFTLVERMTTRAEFLQSCINLLNLSNADVLVLEAERVPPASFDVAVFRAFRPLDKKMTKTLLKLIKKDGYLAAYKARREKIDAELDAIHFLVPEKKIIPLTVPFLEDHERNLVLIKKIKGN